MQYQLPWMESESELPDLDPEIDLALGIAHGGHRRRLTLRGDHAFEPFAAHSNAHLVALQLAGAHHHFGVHLNLHGDPILLLQI